MKTNDIRIANLRKLVEQNGGVNAFGAKLGYVNGSFISSICGPNPNRPVSENTARKIEKAFGIADGWLDRKDLAASAPPVINHGLVAEAIQKTAEAVTKIGAQMSPTKLGKLSTLVYDDAVGHGRVRDEFIGELIDLIST